MKSMKAEALSSFKYHYEAQLQSYEFCVLF